MREFALAVDSALARRLETVDEEWLTEQFESVARQVLVVGLAVLSEPPGGALGRCFGLQRLERLGEHPVVQLADQPGDA